MKDAAEGMLMSSIQRLLQKSNPIQENDKQKKEAKKSGGEMEPQIECEKGNLLAATQTAHETAKEEAAHVKSPFAAVPQQLQQQDAAVSLAAQSRTPSLGVMIPRGSGRVERASAAGTPPPPLPL